MNTAEKIEETTTPDRLALAVTGLEPESAISLRSAFDEMFAQADEWAARAKMISVTRVDQVREMRFARESRLALRDIRVKAEHARKRLKEDSTRRGRAIDGISNVLKALIEPIEEHLLEMETFADRAEAAQKNDLRSARQEVLRTLGVDPGIYADLGEATEEAWGAAHDAAKLAHDARIEAAKHAEAVRVEAERIQAEKREAARLAQVKAEAERVERERVQAEENARLREENARIAETARHERELADQARRVAAAEALAAKANADREAAYQADIAKTARDAVENEAKAAREALDRAAREHAASVRVEREKADLAAKELAEVHAKAARARRDREIEAETDRLAKLAAAENAALAPDREKLASFAAVLRGLVIPSLSTEKGKALAVKVSAEIVTLAKRIEKAGASL